MNKLDPHEAHAWALFYAAAMPDTAVIYKNHNIHLCAPDEISKIFNMHNSTACAMADLGVQSLRDRLAGVANAAEAFPRSLPEVRTQRSKRRP